MSEARTASTLVRCVGGPYDGQEWRAYSEEFSVALTATEGDPNPRSRRYQFARVEMVYRWEQD